jgi:metallophosphoesterase (TIGR03768 family)
MKTNKIRICPLLLAALLLIMISSCKQADKATQQPSYPIDSEVYTTVDRNIVPDSVPVGAPKIFPYELAKYAEAGYGKWHFGNGLPYEQRLDLMPAEYNHKGVENSAKLLKFFTMTDIHITDKESPAQAIFFGYKGGIISAYSGIMLYTTQVLDATVQTINALHKKDPFNFGISLGDDANNSQYNETRWFIDVLDGKKINPDSGEKDDPIQGTHNDYQDEYQAAGLDKSIPWYQAIGNHDHNWMGIFPPNDYIKNSFVGDSIIKMGKNIFAPEGINERTIYMGVMDGKTVYGDVIGIGPVSTTKPIKIAADPNRRSLSSIEWATEFFNTVSNPKGHGFNKADVEKGFLCYSFEPKSDIPVKVIVLDDTQKNSDPSKDVHGHSYLDTERYNWLVKELEQGQAEGKLMIIAAHIPIGINDPNPELGWDPNAPISEATLIAKLHTFPNLILWVAGHRHLNTVTALKSPDAARPELGFWEVETSSLREFPQQFRTFEIMRNNNNTVSIYITNVDPAVKKGSFAEISRNYAIAAHQIFNLSFPESYNAELIVPLTTEMNAKIQKSGTPIKKK